MANTTPPAPSSPGKSGPLKKLDQFIVRSRHFLVSRYGEKEALSIHETALDEYLRLIPEIPDIGGRKNPLNHNLVQASWALAVHRSFVRHGKTVEETGEFLRQGLKDLLDRFPGFIKTLMGQFRFTRWGKNRMKRGARRSEKRQYPGDWVFSVIDGDGKDFDLGIDYLECAIEKFLKAQKAVELTPYLCNSDYTVFAALGIGLTRTMTRAWGCEKCDFRMKKDAASSDPWPPEFVERYCGED